MPAAVKLTYLNIKGLGEPIRLALHISDVEFEDERISYSEISARRLSGELPYGQVPVLQVEGSPPLAQSIAILRWAGKQGTLWPAAAQLECHHDMVESSITEINYLLRPQWYGHILGRSPTTGELLIPMNAQQKEQTASALNVAVLPARLQMLEKFLIGPFFCGAQMTTVDLLWYCMGQGFIDGSYCEGVSVEVIASCPGLVELVRCVHEHPKVQEWNASQIAEEDVYDPEAAYAHTEK